MKMQSIKNLIQTLRDFRSYVVQSHRAYLLFVPFFTSVFWSATLFACLAMNPVSGRTEYKVLLTSVVWMIIGLIVEIILYRKRVNYHQDKLDGFLASSG